jgi:ATP-dependent DNA helicase RecG
VLLLIEQGDMGKAAMAAAFGHKSVSGELHKQIRRLLDSDWIEMTLPDKPNSRLQQYRLTASGKSRIADLEGGQS